MSLTIVQRDLQQLTDTTVRDEFGDALLPVWTPTNNPNLLEITRSGWQNPANQPRSHLQRVAYALEDNTFYRKYWRQLHRGAEQEPIQAVLVKDVEEVEFEFLDQNQERWHTEWPPLSTAGTGGLPLAIRLTITFIDESKVVRVVSVNQ
jgi:general secretion pathway protein J